MLSIWNVPPVSSASPDLRIPEEEPAANRLMSLNFQCCKDWHRYYVADASLISNDTQTFSDASRKVRFAVHVVCITRCDNASKGSESKKRGDLGKFQVRYTKPNIKCRKNKKACEFALARRFTLSQNGYGTKVRLTLACKRCPTIRESKKKENPGSSPPSWEGWNLENVEVPGSGWSMVARLKLKGIHKVPGSGRSTSQGWNLRIDKFPGSGMAYRAHLGTPALFIFHKFPGSGMAYIARHKNIFTLIELTLGHLRYSFLLTVGPLPLSHAQKKNEWHCPFDQRNSKNKKKQWLQWRTNQETLQTRQITFSRLDPTSVPHLKFFQNQGRTNHRNQG